VKKNKQTEIYNPKGKGAMMNISKISFLRYLKHLAWESQTILKSIFLSNYATMLQTSWVLHGILSHKDFFICSINPAVLILFFDPRPLFLFYNRHRRFQLF
jgi:hypothetical protein